MTPRTTGGGHCGLSSFKWVWGMGYGVWGMGYRVQGIEFIEFIEFIGFRV